MKYVLTSVLTVLTVGGSYEQVSTLAQMKLRKSPSNLVPPDMVQETMAHIQTTTSFVFQLMSFLVPQDIHSNEQF